MASLGRALGLARDFFRMYVAEPRTHFCMSRVHVLYMLCMSLARILYTPCAFPTGRQSCVACAGRLANRGLASCPVSNLLWPPGTERAVVRSEVVNTIGKPLRGGVRQGSN